MISTFRRRTLGIALAVCVPLSITGCATKGKSGALIGGGIGAVIGQAAGRSTEATLIGAAVGTGIGYIIGNERDKKDAARLSKDESALVDNAPLAGTVWQVTSLAGERKREFQSMVVDFGNNGRVNTTTTERNGGVTRVDERYRVVGTTLIVNKPGYMINARFRVSGNELIIDAEDFRAVLRRLTTR